MANRVRTPSKDIERILVDAAEAVLVRDGLDGVTVRAVAAEARVALAGVYNRFGGKEGLERELLIRGFDALRAEVAAPDDPDPIARLRAAAASYRRFAIEHPQHYSIMFAASVGKHFANEAVQDSAGRAFGELVLHIGYAIGRGTIVGGDPAELAQQVWSALHGAVSLELNGAMRSPDPEGSYASMVDLIIRGLRG
ncbi:TetR-like C-terminal domain-containing protein [Nocardia sp. NPDC046763]|uniref:TetR-like C-terminal domain-containing protein n=1 Tax=Nocardia sp. NPDC046763 TaxID=3155256 RepID=UPI0033E95478